MQEFPFQFSIPFPFPFLASLPYAHWLLHKQKREFSTLRLENLADVSTECFSTFALIKLKQLVKMLARFSDLKVGIKELSFPIKMCPPSLSDILSDSTCTRNFVSVFCIHRNCYRRYYTQFSGCYPFCL